MSHYPKKEHGQSYPSVSAVDRLGAHFIETRVDAKFPLYRLAIAKIAFHALEGGDGFANLGAPRRTILGSRRPRRRSTIGNSP